MALLNITEYSRMAVDASGKPLPIPLADDGAVHQTQLSFTTSAQSAVFAAGTRIVRVISDADAHITFGSNPTADVNDTRLEANVAEYFGVQNDDNSSIRLAAYDGSS